VLDNDFRHPVIVAKEIATLDLLSDGRVDMGMGAGWLEEDYTKTGVASWDSPGTRVDRLFESVGVLRELFTGEPVTHSGEHYRLRDFTSFPKPLQSPVPLMIGGRGKRLLSFAAKHAQIISVLAGGTGGGADDITQFEEQLGWIAEAGGRERDDLVLGLRIPFGMLASPGQSAHQAAEYVGAQRGQSADEVLASPFVLVGDHASIRDHLIEMREHFGITYITLSEEFALQLAPIISDLA
jgi:probable F420-dependent oxidoreductase